MFATPILARRLEAAEAALIGSVALSVARRDPSRNMQLSDLGPGVAVHLGEDAPFNKVIGLGFEPLDPEGLSRFEAAVFAKGCQVRVKLSSLARPEVGEC
ncbi:MAG: hypothetical protein HY901_16125 [Deltaproteobacteria bacterium]|nr:hypothetical protein [Deltaproteobacteria bacterium]